jgi:hypothetical protein
VSYEVKECYGWVVICYLCEQFGAIFDREWRAVRKNDLGAPLHLCRWCRSHAVWCQEHQRYHRPDDLHRHACASCGGLFTTRVKERIDYCPSCRSAMRVVAGART